MCVVCLPEHIEQLQIVLHLQKLSNNNTLEISNQLLRLPHVKKGQESTHIVCCYHVTLTNPMALTLVGTPRIV